MADLRAAAHEARTGLSEALNGFVARRTDPRVVTVTAQTSLAINVERIADALEALVEQGKG